MSKNKEEEKNELLEFLRILMNGYSKPDLAEKERSPSGVVRETKNVFKYITAVCDRLCELNGCDVPETRITRRPL